MTADTIIIILLIIFCAYVVTLRIDRLERSLTSAHEHDAKESDWGRLDDGRLVALDYPAREIVDPDGARQKNEARRSTRRRASFLDRLSCVHPAASGDPTLAGGTSKHL